MQTAAGVAAGALAFEGVESLMHGFGHEGGGQGLGGFDGGQRPTEEIVNNYYGDDRGGGHDVSADEKSLGQQEDRDYGSRGGSDASSNDRDSLSGSDDTGAGDDASFDSDSSSDDASFDDGGDDGSGGGDDSSFA